MFSVNRCYVGQNIPLVLKNLLMSAFLKRSKILMILVAFCSPEFDSFLNDLAIFQLKCNEQHFSIPESQIKIPAMFS